MGLRLGRVEGLKSRMDSAVRVLFAERLILQEARRGRLGHCFRIPDHHAGSAAKPRVGRVLAACARHDGQTALPVLLYVGFIVHEAKPLVVDQEGRALRRLQIGEAALLQLGYAAGQNNRRCPQRGAVLERQRTDGQRRRARENHKACQVLVMPERLVFDQLHGGRNDERGQTALVERSVCDRADGVRNLNIRQRGAGGEAVDRSERGIGALGEQNRLQTLAVFKAACLQRLQRRGEGEPAHGAGTERLGADGRHALGQLDVRDAGIVEGFLRDRPQGGHFRKIDGGKGGTALEAGLAELFQRGRQR